MSSSSSGTDLGGNAHHPSIASARSEKEGGPPVASRSSTTASNENAERGMPPEKETPSVSLQASFAPGDQTHRKLKSRHIQLIGTYS